MSERQGVPSIAIVVVSWNGLQDTLTCLTALRRLEHAERCVVLVDNGSLDGTVDVVQRYFPEVKVIANAANLGYVRANNQGIAWGLDRGADWILLLNNDVVVTPGALTEMLRVGESVPEVGIVGPVMQRTLRPDILDLGGDLHLAWGGVSLRRYTDAQRERDWLPVDYVWGCTLMARREVLERIGGLDPVYVAYFEDGDLCLRARRLGYRTVAALRARVMHQVGRSGEKRFLWQTAYRMRNHVLFFARYARPWHWPTLIPSLLLLQLPFVALQSTRAYLARKLQRRKYAVRQITLWGYERRLQPPDQAQIEQWLDEAGYPAR
jgi:GT2 family glycosyltransferase